MPQNGLPDPYPPNTGLADQPALNMRMFPPVKPGWMQTTAYGRSYSGTVGVPLTVSAGDGGLLEANGWTLIAISGSSAARPRKGSFQLSPGLRFYDEDLGKLIIYDGATWRDLDGNSV